MNLILGIVGIILSVVIYVASANYDIFMYDVVGGGGFPRMLACIICLCSLVVIRQHLSAKKKAAVAGEIKDKKYGDIKAAVLLVMGVLVYILALEYIGYLVMTMILVAFLLWVQGEHNPKTIVKCVVVISGLLYVLFVWVLRVKLPTGFLI